MYELSAWRDGKKTIIPIDKATLRSMAMTIAFRLQQENSIVQLAKEVTMGDIKRIDENVELLVQQLGLDGQVAVLDAKDALKLCDDLADAVYAGPSEELLYAVCSYCQKATIKPCECPESKRAKLKVVK